MDITIFSFLDEDKKGSKGKLKSPWSLHIGTFWKTHFINPPEVRGQVVRLVVYGLYTDDAKVSKTPFGVNRKIEDSAPVATARKSARF